MHQTQKQSKNENYTEAETLNALWDPDFNGLQRYCFKKYENNFNGNDITTNLLHKIWLILPSKTGNQFISKV